MKYLKTQKQYTESLKFDLSILDIDVNESLTIWYDSLLDSIGAEEISLEELFDKDLELEDLDKLSNNKKFIKSLKKKGLRISQVENSDDYETFLKSPCRFMFIYNIDSIELENPIYIILQRWSDSEDKWENYKCYKVNNDIKKFYDKLTSKVIELIDGDNKYIYNTTNGTEWLLQNTDKENKTYKKYLRRDDFEVMIKNNKIKINII